MNVHDFLSKKKENKKITMLTCYDYWSAKILNETDVDCLLVGDSLSMVMHGYNDTTHATIDMMALHCKSVSKGAPNKYLVGDMPFLSFRKGLSSTMSAVEKIMQSGAHCVKIEGVKGHEEIIEHIVSSGVPVMGHLGLTPQSIHALGGHKVQGKESEHQDRILNEAKKLQDLGCFSLVLECIPKSLATQISSKLFIPTIGIGAGSGVDGQVLVLQDLLGMSPSFQPKFLKQYINGFEMIQSAVNEYVCEVNDRSFPEEKHSYGD